MKNPAFCFFSVTTYYRLAVLVYRCLNGSAPGYLASDLQRVWHLNARRRLRSSTTSALVAPRTVRATIGDRTFPAAAASVWNSLPESVRASASLQVFRSRLKTELFAVVQLLWLRASHCTDYHVTSLLFLRVTNGRWAPAVSHLWGPSVSSNWITWMSSAPHLGRNQ